MQRPTTFHFLEGMIDWNNVDSFSNSWVNYGGAEPVAAYGLDGLERLWFKGTIKNGTTGVAAFTLPQKYRPSVKKSVICLYSGAGVAYIDINTDGTVVPQGTTAPSYFVLMGTTPLT